MTYHLHPIDPQAKSTLHQASKVLLTARLLGSSPLPNGLRHSLLPTLGEAALTTGILSFGGELRLNFMNPSIHHVQNGETVFDIPLDGHTQKSLFHAVYGEYARMGLSLIADEAYITEDTPFEFTSKATHSLYEAMMTIYGWIASVKARFLGFQTPLVWWTHGFDLSCLWFARGMDEHTDPHLNIGFSPGTPDVGEPYLYVYVYPSLSALEQYLPEGMTWTTQWSAPGAYLRYSQIITSADPAERVMSTVWSIYKTVNGMMK